MESLSKKILGFSAMVLLGAFFLETSAYAKCECYTYVHEKTPDGKMKYTFQCYDPEDSESDDHLKSFPNHWADTTVPIEKVKSEVLAPYKLEHLKQCIKVGTKYYVPK